MSWVHVHMGAFLQGLGMFFLCIPNFSPGFQIFAAVSSAWSQPQASPQPPTKLPLFLASSQASCLSD
ncbi:hypothetical protein AMECASPLE_007153 [Ameca splendens]|uniref:Uncharacterized protein n=1 Tax=Ameca splendens TaxID=208324 RepID=A0ABV0ZVI9_9TELE